jgi:hypothetical protein
VAFLAGALVQDDAVVATSTATAHPRLICC